MLNMHWKIHLSVWINCSERSRLSCENIAQQSWVPVILIYIYIYMDTWNNHRPFLFSSWYSSIIFSKYLKCTWKRTWNFKYFWKELESKYKYFELFPKVLEYKSKYSEKYLQVLNYKSKYKYLHTSDFEDFYDFNIHNVHIS